MQTQVGKEVIQDDKLAKLLLKKIRLEVTKGQAILHVSKKHNQITEMLEANNLITKVESLTEFFDQNPEIRKKAFTYVIADMDNESLDDFDKFLDKAAPLIIRPGLLIIVATNMTRLSDKIRLFFGKSPKKFTRPLRSVPEGYLRDKLLEKGFFVKNRYWHYGDKLLIMADIPNQF